MVGKLDDALLGADRAADDVATGVIREGGEQAIYEELADEIATLIFEAAPKSKVVTDFPRATSAA